MLSNIFDFHIYLEELILLALMFQMSVSITKASNGWLLTNMCEFHWLVMAGGKVLVRWSYQHKTKSLVTGANWTSLSDKDEVHVFDRGFLLLNWLDSMASLDPILLPYPNKPNQPCPQVMQSLVVAPSSQPDGTQGQWQVGWWTSTPNSVRKIQLNLGDMNIQVFECFFLGIFFLFLWCPGGNSRHKNRGVWRVALKYLEFRFSAVFIEEFITDDTDGNINMVLKVHWARGVRFTIRLRRSWGFVQMFIRACANRAPRERELNETNQWDSGTISLFPKDCRSGKKTLLMATSRSSNMIVHLNLPFHGQYLPCGVPPPFYLYRFGFWSARFDTPVSVPWEDWKELLERWNVGEITRVGISQPRKQGLYSWC